MFEGARVLDHVDAPISSLDAERLAIVAFGVRAKAQRLGGERDYNFHLDSKAGAFVLKISNSAEDLDVIEFQTAALLHIAAADPKVPAPRVQMAQNGHPFFVWKSEGAARAVRLLTFLPGRPLHTVKADAELLRRLGQAIAGLDLSLRGFSHPASQHELLWDLQHASRLTDFVRAVHDSEHRELAEFGLRLYHETVAQKLPTQRSQVIHNDFNPYNVLVAGGQSGRVTGLIDLGDAVWAPLVDEVAVAAAYHLGGEPNPLALSTALVRGYHSRLPLREAELELIYPLVATRLAMTVIIASWRAAKHPDNREYILRNRPAALRGLAHLREFGDRATGQLLEALQEVPK